MPVSPRVAAHRALQRIAAAVVRLDAWDIPRLGRVPHPDDHVLVRRDRYDALARACGDLIESEA